MNIIDWRAALGAELAPVLATLARGEGASPAGRYRAEGFARAVCKMGIASGEEIILFVQAVYAEALGEAASAYSADDFRMTENEAVLPCIPVRLPRAPVFTGSAT